MAQPPQASDPSQYGGQPPFGQPPYGGQPGDSGGDGQQPPRKRTGLVIAIVVAALLVTAGAVTGVVLLTGDDSGSSNTAVEGSTSAPTTTAVTTTAATTPPDQTTSVAPPTSVAPSGDSYCEKLRGYDRDEDLKDLDFSSEAGQQKLIDVLEDLQSEAPSDLKDDYQIVVDGFRSITAGNVENIDEAKFTKAFTQIGQDAAKSCGVDMGG